MSALKETHALIIGISNYQYVPSLTSAVINDAKQVYEILSDSRIGGYDKSNITLLLDEEATKTNIQRELSHLSIAKPESTVLIYFSGHGARPQTEGERLSYLLSYETHLEQIADTAISEEELTKYLNAIPSEQIVLILDCCHAAGLSMIKTALEEAFPNFKGGLSEKAYDAFGHNRVVIASSRASEVSYILNGEIHSLFTKHLLSAFRHTPALTTIFDIFNQIEAKFATEKVRQHPVLKASLERNFPVLFPPIKPAMVFLDNRAGVTLAEEEIDLLKKIFEGHPRITLLKEFGHGQGGCRVLDVKPFDRKGNYQKNVVVKMGPLSLIVKEQSAYLDYAVPKFSSIVSLRKEITKHPTLDLAGIVYALAGDGIFSVESLQQMIQVTPLVIKDISDLLIKDLFPSFKTVWTGSQLIQDSLIRHSYDKLLPVNLFLDHTPDQNPDEIYHASTIDPVTIKSSLGAILSLKGFVITEIDTKKRLLTLDTPYQWSQEPEPLIGGYRVRFKLRENDNVDIYREGDQLSNIIGTVRVNRMHQLKEACALEVAQHFDLSSPRLQLQPPIDLPNPLFITQKILSQRLNMQFAYIHGDLNLNNVLVIDGRHPQIIDFAEIRFDHILHDFLRLESNLWIYLVTHLLQQKNGSNLDVYYLVTGLNAGSDQDTLFPPKLQQAYQVIQVVRGAARAYLSDPSNDREYQIGLFLYLVGSLKFSVLDKIPKTRTVLFIAAAATAAYLLNEDDPLLPLPVSPERIDYDDLRIVISSQTPDHYLIEIKSRLLPHPVFKHTIKKREIGNYLVSLTAEPHRLSEIGQILYQQIFPEDLERSIHTYLMSAADANTPRQVLLDLRDAPELQIFPWEYLTNRASSTCLGSLPNIHLSRIGNSYDLSTQPIEGPIRVLITTNRAALETESYQASIQSLKSLRHGNQENFDFTILESCEFNDFRRKLLQESEWNTPYHIWHHIATDENPELFAGLPFEDGYIDVKQINTVLYQSVPLKLGFFYLLNQERSFGLPFDFINFALPLIALLREDGSSLQLIQAVERSYQGLLNQPAYTALQDARRGMFLAADPTNVVQPNYLIVRKTKNPIICKSLSNIGGKNDTFETATKKFKITQVNSGVIRARNFRRTGVEIIGEPIQSVSSRFDPQVEQIEITQNNEGTIDADMVEEAGLRQIHNIDVNDYLEALIEKARIITEQSK